MPQQLCRIWCVQKWVISWPQVSSCRIVWKRWTYEILVRCTVFCWVRSQLSPFSHLSYMKCMGSCVISLPISLLMVVRILMLHHNTIIKSKLWIISHCSVLDHETMVYDVCINVSLWPNIIQYLNIALHRLTQNINQNVTSPLRPNYLVSTASILENIICLIKTLRCIMRMHSAMVGPLLGNASINRLYQIKGQ